MNEDISLVSYTPSEKNGFFSQIVWHSQFFVVVLQILGEYPGMGDCINNNTVKHFS